MALKYEKMTDKEYKKKVFKRLSENHIWVNSLFCIHPSDELKMKIGEQVLDMLNYSDGLLPSETITSEDKTMRDLANLKPILYLRVNKS